MRLLFLALSLVVPMVLPVTAQAACAGRLVESDNVLASPLCLPSEPKRIVALDPTYSLAMALELGLPVIGAPLFGMSDPGLQAEARRAGVEDVGSAGEPSIERIITLKPDLVIGDGILHEPALAMASRIAPTLLVKAQNWKTYFSTLAAATGRADKAEAAFAAYERRAADIRARMPDVRVSVIRITPHGFQVYLDGPSAYAPFSVMRDAGVRRSAYETTTDTSILKRPDWEGIAALDGDVLLYIVGSSYDSDGSGKLEAETVANPFWQMLPAVRAGRAHRVDVTTWMAFGGIASANRVLDDIERFVLARP